MGRLALMSCYSNPGGGSRRARVTGTLADPTRTERVDAPAARAPARVLGAMVAALLAACAGPDAMTPGADPIRAASLAG